MEFINQIIYEIKETFLPHLKKILFGICIIFSANSFTIIKTSEVGIKSKFGIISDSILCEGFHLKIPFVDKIEKVSLKQHRDDSSIKTQTIDFQDISINYQVMYSIPAKFVIDNKKKINGDVFEVVIKKRSDESFRNIISHYQAIDVLQNRQQIIREISQEVNSKLSGIAEVDNILLLKLTFSEGFQQKVNEKMVATQEAETAKVNRQKAQYEADAKVIEAQGRADAMKIEAKALSDNKKILELRQIEVNRTIAEKWDGKSPSTVVINGKDKTNIILPIN